MRSFIFHNPVKIYFGEGQAVHVAEEAKSRLGAVLLVYGGGSIKRNGAYDDVTAALREAGNEVIELSGVTPNPRLDKVLEGVKLVKEHGVSLILAVGGGSVIDCAKFISLGSGLGEDEDLWDDYVETGKPAPENLVPLGVVLTTAATGSEMGDAAVLTNWARNRKLGYTSFPLTPKFSVLDPTYLLTLPDEQTTYGFVDMFCHTCEQYFSLPSDDNLSDEMVEAIQRHILAPGAPAAAIRAAMRPAATRCGIPRSRSTASSRAARRRIGSRTASSTRCPPTSTSRTVPVWPWSIRTG